MHGTIVMALTNQIFEYLIYFCMWFCINFVISYCLHIRYRSKLISTYPKYGMMIHLYPLVPKTFQGAVFLVPSILKIQN